MNAIVFVALLGSTAGLKRINPDVKLQMGQREIEQRQSAHQRQFLAHAKTVSQNFTTPLSPGLKNLLKALKAGAKKAKQDSTHDCGRFQIASASTHDSSTTGCASFTDPVYEALGESGNTALSKAEIRIMCESMYQEDDSGGTISCQWGLNGCQAGEGCDTTCTGGETMFQEEVTTDGANPVAAILYTFTEGDPSSPESIGCSGHRSAHQAFIQVSPAALTQESNSLLQRANNPCPYSTVKHCSDITAAWYNTLGETGYDDHEDQSWSSMNTIQGACSMLMQSDGAQCEYSNEGDATCSATSTFPLIDGCSDACSGTLGVDFKRNMVSDCVDLYEGTPAPAIPFCPHVYVYHDTATLMHCGSIEGTFMDPISYR